LSTFTFRITLNSTKTTRRTCDFTYPPSITEQSTNSNSWQKHLTESFRLMSKKTNEMTSKYPWVEISLI
jgi:hypothetical protein